MQNDKLLLCPFCGGESARAITKERLFLGQNEFAVKKIDVVGYVKCNKCHARGGTVSAILYKNTKTYFDDIAKLKEEAIKLWNTRKPMERILEQLEELKEEKNDISSKIRNAEDKRCYGFYELGIDEATDIVRKGGVDNAN